MKRVATQTPLYAPSLHRNPLIAALQLLSWLFLRPSAWQQQIRQIAPDLRPDFTLLDIRVRHWRQSALRRLLRLIYLLWPFLTALLTAVILWIIGAIGNMLWLGAIVGFVLGAASGLLLGLCLSVAASLSGVIGGGLALGLLVGLLGQPIYEANSGDVHLQALPGYMAYNQSEALQPAVVDNAADRGTATPQLLSVQLTANTPTPILAQVAAAPQAEAAIVAFEPTTIPVVAAEAAQPATIGEEMALPLTPTPAVVTVTTGVTTTIRPWSVNATVVSPLATPILFQQITVLANDAGPQSAEPTVVTTTAPPVFTSPLGSTPTPAPIDLAVLSDRPDNQASAYTEAESDAYTAIENFSVTPAIAVLPPTAQLSHPSSPGNGALPLLGALGLLVIGVVIGLATTIADSAPRQNQRPPAAVSWRQTIGSLAIGLLVSIVVTLVVFGLTYLFRPQLMAAMVWATRSSAGDLLWLGLFVAIGGALFIALPYQLSKRLAGALAGGVAGALGGGGALALLLLQLTDQPLWPRWLLSLFCLALGLALPLWWPLLHYPVAAAWSSLLFRWEQRRTDNQELLLPYHPAFWDELQPLPLPALDDYLVLAVERKPVQGKVALQFLGKGRQRWAAQAAQIELDARRLAACERVADIPVACRQVVAGELSNAASALLRTFSRVGADVETALAHEGLYNQRLALAAVEERLDGLLRELTRSNERYAVRFLAIAEGWWALVHGAVNDLAAAAESRQEIESPYIIGIPLTAQQEIFVGRADVCERIEQLLRDQRHPPLLLYGQRRMGKTSLLNNLGRLLPDMIVPLFVDLQGPVALAGDHAVFLYNLARAMSESARRQRDLTLPPLARAALADDPFTRFDEWLDEVEQAIGNRTVLMALDEFEVLESAFAAGRLQAEAVLGSLRHWVQHRPRFKILLTGSHVVEELSSWANYLLNVQVVHIGYLTETETHRLVEQPVKDFALRYEPAASQRVWELSRGHPALTQLLCYELVTIKNQQPPTSRRLATVADIEAAALAALEHGALFFHEIESGQLTAAAVTLLRWLAAQGAGAVAAVEQVQAVWPETFGPTIKLLLRRGLIEYTKGGYRFQVELIRRWFEQKP